MRGQAAPVDVIFRDAGPDKFVEDTELEEATEFSHAEGHTEAIEESDGAVNTSRVAEDGEARSSELVSQGASLLFAVLLIAPILYGCVHPFWRSSLAAVLSALGCVSLCAMLFRGTRLRLAPGTVPLTMFTILVLFQTLPIGPELRPDIVASLGLETAGSQSIVPAITMSRARDCLGLLVVFVGASLLLSNRGVARDGWRGRCPSWPVSWQCSTSRRRFLEIVPGHAQADHGHVFGTYLNRNHLGAFFVLALIVRAGLFVNRRQNAQPPLSLDSTGARATSSFC